MKSSRSKLIPVNKIIMLTVLFILMILNTCLAGQTLDRTRIAVLPFYTEAGRDIIDGGNATLDYRRVIRFINTNLVKHGYEVISPFAKDSAEHEYNRAMERAREDSPLAVMEMCKKYDVDAVIIVWLKVKWERLETVYKAYARLDAEAYDSAGRDLGVAFSRNFMASRKFADDALAEVEKEVGYLVGERMTARPISGHSNNIAGNSNSRIPDESVSKNQLEQNIKKYEVVLYVRVDGATEWIALEAVGKVFNSVRGVTAAKRYSQRINPENPKACTSSWRLNIRDTDSFRLQANVMTMIEKILDAGGDIPIGGVPYRYTPAEIKLLMALRPGDASSREVQFVFDRNQMRDKEIQGRHDPHIEK